MDDLFDDMRAVPVNFVRKGAGVVRSNARLGNGRAKAFAKESAGAHGKHYHKAFTAEALSALSWEYGPDAGQPQGGMSFEFGSRNQPPHLDLARSLDIQGPQFRKDVSALLDGLFWP